jgi:hypothetical protein
MSCQAQTHARPAAQKHSISVYNSAMPPPRVSKHLPTHLKPLLIVKSDLLGWFLILISSIPVSTYSYPNYPATREPLPYPRTIPSHPIPSHTVQARARGARASGAEISALPRSGHAHDPSTQHPAAQHSTAQHSTHNSVNLRPPRGQIPSLVPAQHALPNPTQSNPLPLRCGLGKSRS